MNRIILLLSLLLSLCGTAQAQLIKEKEPVDPKYLAGMVPVNADGLVAFEADVALPAGMTDDLAFSEVKHWLGQYFIDHQVNQRKSLAVDSAAHYVQVGVNEWIVFKQNALVLDRSQMVYTLSAQVGAGKVHLIMTDIAYYYHENGDEKHSTRYEAEGFITDDEGLTRRKDRLAWKNGKFRVKTIDTFHGLVDSLTLRLAGR